MIESSDSFYFDETIFEICEKIVINIEKHFIKSTG